MKKIAIAIALAIVALIAARAAFAYTCDPATNVCRPTVSWTEASTYVSGASLTDLKDSVYTYQVDGVAQAPIVTPASRPQGGNAQSITSIGITVPVCKVVVMTGSLVERTIAGGISVPTQQAPLSLDRTKLANGQPDPSCTTPSPATGLTAQ